MFVKNLLIKNRLCAYMKYVRYNFTVVTFQIVKTTDIFRTKFVGI